MKYVCVFMCGHVYVSGGAGSTETGGAGSVCWSSEGAAGADSVQSGAGTE